ncbi:MULTISPECIES: epoxide hydrolase N-terminal domain-containing protein [Pseudomonas]|uniref:epoxide hydrolase N-terminal domain-containing protein n=1 Tax=Pseudomonadaceae TaxID=135621 RepID=UPI0010F86795|nr:MULTISPECIES: epoxide hydrolase N-terminal domain-containing protein [Pseudomonas]MDE3738171.1 epoxide hydrolase N-terminal domain-containing protein [Pseudomonas resinovorans]
MKPFRVDVPDAVLNDQHTRLKLTRWVEDFANEGWQYGTPAPEDYDADEAPMAARLQNFFAT